jgi:Ca-activated chloride channel family protein
MRSVSLLLATLLVGQPTFRSGVDLVRIPMNLERSADATIPPDALTAASFTVLEDGVPQQVSLFERESVPLRLCIVLDISHSMMDPRASRLSTGAYGHAITALRAADEVAVITFAMSSSRIMSWTPAAKAAAMPLRLRTDGGTAILDAVKRAVKEFDTSTPGRPVILVITDGGENASFTGVNELVASRIQSEAQIHGFQIAGAPTVTPPSVTGRRPLTDKQTGVKTIDVLPKVVSDAGGVIYNITTAADVPAATKQLFDELRTQYTLGYTPARPFDGKYRRVRVEMNAPGYTVRHRGGYLAMPLK